MPNVPKTMNTWDWKALGAPHKQARPMSLKLKSTLQALAMAAVGYVIYRIWGHPVGPAIVWSLAGLVLIGGWVFPPIFHGFEKFGAKLAFWVAGGLTWGLLVPFFYITFTFGRLILLVSGKDPMDRRFPDAERTSFWTPRPPVPSMAQYRKQH